MTYALRQRDTMRQRLADPDLLSRAVEVDVSEYYAAEPIWRLAVPVGGARRAGAIRLASPQQAIAAMAELAAVRAQFPYLRIREDKRRSREPLIVTWGEDTAGLDGPTRGQLYGYTQAASMTLTDDGDYTELGPERKL